MEKFGVKIEPCVWVKDEHGNWDHCDGTFCFDEGGPLQEKNNEEWRTDIREYTVNDFVLIYGEKLKLKAVERIKAVAVDKKG